MEHGQGVQHGAAFARAEAVAESAGDAVRVGEDAHPVPGADPVHRTAARGGDRRDHEIPSGALPQGEGGVHGPAQSLEGGVGARAAVALVRQVGDGDEPAAAAGVVRRPVVVAEAHGLVRP